MTERQQLQQLSKLFPYQVGIPGSNKTRRLRRKRIKFMRSWLSAIQAGILNGFLLPQFQNKTLLIKPLAILNIQKAFITLKDCYDGSARYINSR